jgi:hypothetical protein
LSIPHAVPARWQKQPQRIVAAKSVSSNRAGPANIGQLYAVDVDGGNLRKLTDGPGAFVQPSWSRDGKRIYAFQHWETEEFGNLAVFEVMAPLGSRQ